MTAFLRHFFVSVMVAERSLIFRLSILSALVHWEFRQSCTLFNFQITHICCNTPDFVFLVLLCLKSQLVVCTFLQTFVLTLPHTRTAHALMQSATRTSARLVRTGRRLSILPCAQPHHTHAQFLKRHLLALRSGAADATICDKTSTTSALLSLCHSAV